MTTRFSRGLFACLGAMLLFPGMALAQGAADTGVQPWMNTALSPDARADLVQAQMTQDEELTLVHGYLGVNASYRPAPPELRDQLPGSAGYVPGIPRLGIPSLRESDASLGVANGGHMRPGDQATALPSSLLTASTWNPDLAYAGGAMIGNEARNKNFNVLLAGGMDLARDPRNGRTFEYGGEDPLLAGIMTGAAVRGTQDQHIISTVKHYAMNDQETGRFVVNAHIDDAAMRESDLLAFEIAIEKGMPGAVMCAYNRVNSVYSCENKYLLNDVLKTDWGYAGFVLSDWGAVHSTVDAANNGLDQESAYQFDHQDYFGAALKQAIADGKVSQARLQDMVHRILRSMFANGLFDYPAGHGKVDLAADAAVAERDAEEGIVLLKNDGNLLPLGRHARRIAVIGSHADIGVLSGGGSSQVIPIGDTPDTESLTGGPVFTPVGRAMQIPGERIVYDPPSPLSAIRGEAKSARVVFNDGGNPQSAADLARKSDVAIIFVEQWMHEGSDVPDLLLHGVQNDLIAAVAAANPHTIVVLETGGPVAMPWIANVGAVLEAWFPGQRGTAAIANILFGKVNPSGHTAITFPESDSQLPRQTIPGYDPVNPWLSGQRPFDVDYNKEGADVGYKWFAAQGLKPLFPFGYGLSYTTFSLSGLSVTGGTTISASFDVRNTGKRAGKEVAQVYATPPSADGKATPRLIGWSKVDLKPGETRHVTVTADPRVLADFDTDAHLWRVAAGNYTVSLGSSFTDISTTANTPVEASTIKP